MSKDKTLIAAGPPDRCQNWWTHHQATDYEWMGTRPQAVKDTRQATEAKVQIGLNGLETVGVTKTVDFSEKSQTAFDPPPLIFRKSCCKFCINFMLKKLCLKVQNLQHKFFDPFGIFPKIHPFRWHHLSLSGVDDEERWWIFPWPSSHRCTISYLSLVLLLPEHPASWRD